jgi:phytoene dehydrogenase-like protein
LVAALYLQRAGHQVVLLEAKARVGGCASSFSTNGFTFLSGATTLVGLEPDLPLGRVLRELQIDFSAPIAATNLALWQGDTRTLISTDAHANLDTLARNYSPKLATFWKNAAAVGAVGWSAVTELHFPPRHAGDLFGAATNSKAWSLVPALLRSTSAVLGDVSPRERELVDQLLLVSTQATAAKTPYLFGALGVEYLQRPMSLAEGGLAALLEHLGRVFVARGGTLHLQHPVTRVARRPHGFAVTTPHGEFEAELCVLNLTHWNAAEVVDRSLNAGFEGTCARHPDAWATCTLYVGTRDVFEAEAPPYHQVVLDRPMPTARARSIFVTLSRRDDRTQAPEGFRAVTVSCHTPAREWEHLDEATHAVRKAAVRDELLAALTNIFPALAHAEKPVVLPGTPRTWQDFTGRLGGRVGGLPFTFETLARGYPTGRTRVPKLVRVGDTVFPGQSVPACAWGARRVVGELLADAAPSRRAA